MTRNKATVCFLYRIRMFLVIILLMGACNQIIWAKNISLKPKFPVSRSTHPLVRSVLRYYHNVKICRQKVYKILKPYETFVDKQFIKQVTSGFCTLAGSRFGL